MTARESGGPECPDDFEPYAATVPTDGYRLFLTWVRNKKYGDEKDTIQCRFAALAPDGDLHIAGGSISDEERGDILHVITKLLQKALDATEGEK